MVEIEKRRVELDGAGLVIAVWFQVYHVSDAPRWRHPKKGLY